MLQYVMGVEGTRETCGLGDILPCITYKGRMFAHETERGVSLQLKYEVKWWAIRPEESGISWNHLLEEVGGS